MMDTIMRLAVFLVTLKPSACVGSSSVHTHTYAQMVRQRRQLITLTLTTVLHPESANNIFLYSLYMYIWRENNILFLTPPELNICNLYKAFCQCMTFYEASLPTTEDAALLLVPKTYKQQLNSN